MAKTIETIRYRNGIYRGEFEDGERNGKGTYKWKDGSEYDGEFVNGKRNGNGKLEYVNGNVYEGDWKNDDWHGHGKIKYANSSEYDGEFVNGKRNGNGKLEYANGNVYEGDWKDDMWHGHGKMKYANSSEYDGEWLRGKRHGGGIQTSVWNICRYDGGWRNDKWHGKGTVAWFWSVVEFEGEWEGRLPRSMPICRSVLLVGCHLGALVLEHLWDRYDLLIEFISNHWISLALVLVLGFVTLKLGTQCSTLTDENMRLKQELVAASNKNTTLRSDLDTANSQVSTLTADKIKLNDELAAAKIEVSRLTEEDSNSSMLLLQCMPGLEAGTTEQYEYDSPLFHEESSGKTPPESELALGEVTDDNDVIPLSDSKEFPKQYWVRTYDHMGNSTENFCRVTIQQKAHLPPDGPVEIEEKLKNELIIKLLQWGPHFTNNDGNEPTLQGFILACVCLHWLGENMQNVMTKRINKLIKECPESLKGKFKAIVGMSERGYMFYFASTFIANLSISWLLTRFGIIERDHKIARCNLIFRDAGAKINICRGRDHYSNTAALLQSINGKWKGSQQVDRLISAVDANGQNMSHDCFLMKEPHMNDDGSCTFDRWNFLDIKEDDWCCGSSLSDDWLLRASIGRYKEECWGLIKAMGQMEEIEIIRILCDGVVSLYRKSPFSKSSIIQIVKKYKDEVGGIGGPKLNQNMVESFLKEIENGSIKI